MDKIKKTLEYVSDLKERYQKICEADGTEVTDCIDFDVLILVENGFKGILEELKINQITDKTRINLVMKTKKILTGFLE